MLSLKEDIDDGCPSVLCNKDIVLDSDNGWIVLETNNEADDVAIDGG